MACTLSNLGSDSSAQWYNQSHLDDGRIQLGQEHTCGAVKDISQQYRTVLYEVARCFPGGLALEGVMYSRDGLNGGDNGEKVKSQILQRLGVVLYFILVS